MTNLRKEIASLSAGEKLESLDVLWESLEADVTNPTNEQRVELNSRAARYAQNSADVIPWENVKAGLFKNY